MTDYILKQLGKALQLLYGKEMAYTLQYPFIKSDYSPVCVMPEFNHDSTILIMVPEAEI